MPRPLGRRPLGRRPTLMTSAAAFDILLSRPALRGIRAIAWDLDKTLGGAPGWHDVTLRQYVKHPEIMRALIRYLHTKHGVVSVLVSRNGGFCEGMFADSARMAEQLGFHHTSHCPSDFLERPKSAFVIDTYPTVKPGQVLLIDDQAAECELAVHAGAHAIQCKRGLDALGTILSGTFVMYHPGR